MGQTVTSGRRTADVCVIGGGLVGCFTALFLVERGRSVIVLEARAAGRAASGVNFGNMRLQGRNPAEYPLALSAHDLWERLDSVAGVPTPITRSGQAYIALGADQHERLGHIAREAACAGINVDLLRSSDVRRRWPQLSDLVTAATWSPRDAVSEPGPVAMAVAGAARRAGATFLEQCPVTRLSTRPDGIEVATTGGLVVRCRYAVNAAGAWAGRIAAGAGEPVPMFAAGPQLIETRPAYPLGLPSMLAADGSIIFRQRADGRVLTTMFPRQSHDLDTEPGAIAPGQIAATLTRLAEVVPALAGLTAERAWSGLEGYLPDMLPVIGPSRMLPGLIHAFGFSGHGYQLAPGVGRAVADLVTSGAAGVPIEAFAIERWRGKVRPDERLAREFEPEQAAAAAREAERSHG
jgi:sarcosine oxidase subunit beta